MTAIATLHGLAEIAAKFAARDAAAPDDFPAENIAAIKRSGVLVAPFPERLGGTGASLLDAVKMTEIVAKQSPSTALMLSMPLGLASVYGAAPDTVPEQHRKLWNDQVDAVAAEFRAGKWYAACNSEKGAGGSLAATKTTARLDGGTWRVTGDKILASAGKYADYFFASAKVTQDDLPGAGIVEVFYVKTDAPGVTIAEDWDGFGMRSTESQSVRYDDAPAEGLLGYPDFLESAAPVSVWYCLFPVVSLGCAASMLEQIGTPAPQSPALRLRLAEARVPARDGGAARRDARPALADDARHPREDVRHAGVDEALRRAVRAQRRPPLQPHLAGRPRARRLLRRHGASAAARAGARHARRELRAVGEPTPLEQFGAR